MLRISSLLVYSNLLMLFGFVLSSAASAQQLTVAVAANFVMPMKAIITDFEQKSHHEIKLVSGSSGRFFAQINHGAPFDIFLSADTDKPQKLIDSGLALPHSLFTYAYGRLVLWSADNDREVSMEALSENKFDHLAIANAKLAPYGKAAKEVLAQLDLEKATRSKWVIGENISQTYQFVASQNAELGFIAASQWKNNRSGWLVPEKLHQPIQQNAVILTRAKDNKAAFELVEYLQSPAAAVIIQAYGYQVVSSANEKPDH